MGCVDKINRSRFLNVVCNTLMGILLLLIFLSSFTACAESDQEIGVPYFDSRNTKGAFDKHATAGKVDSAALAPTGERLFTLKDGVLYQYGLSPLKRINSTVVEFDTHQTEDDPYRIFVTNNEKRTIIYQKTRLRLLDMETGKIIRTIPFKSQVGVLNDDEFLTLDDENRGIVWNANKLTKKSEFFEEGEARWSNTENEDISYNYDLTNASIVKGHDYIVLCRPPGYESGEVYVLGVESYKQIWRIKYLRTGLPWASYNLETLYIGAYGEPIWNSGKDIYHIYEPREDKHRRFPGGIIRIDLSSGKSELIDKAGFNQRLHFPLWSDGRWKQLSPAHQYFIAMSIGSLSLIHISEPTRPY